VGVTKAASARPVLYTIVSTGVHAYSTRALRLSYLVLARKAQCGEGLCFLQPPPPPSYHSMIPFHRCGVGSDRCAKIEPSATWHAMKLVCGCTRSFLCPTTLVSVQSNIHPPPFSPQETRSGSLARERLRGGLALNPQPAASGLHATLWHVGSQSYSAAPWPAAQARHDASGARTTYPPYGLQIKTSWLGHLPRQIPV